MTDIIEIPFVGGKYSKSARFDKNSLPQTYHIPITKPMRYDAVNIAHPEKAYYVEVYELRKYITGEYVYVFDHEEK